MSHSMHRVVGPNSAEVDFQDNSGATNIILDGSTISAAEVLRTCDVSARVVNLTDATLSVTQAAHEGKTITLNKADGITITLPAASGSGSIYKFFVGTTLTSNGVIQVASADDILQGVIGVATDAAGVNVPTASDSDTITMNGSTTGGLKGSFIEIQDVASGVFAVRGGLVSTGAEATPFSAAVS